jgi:hypothetical protein
MFEVSVVENSVDFLLNVECGDSFVLFSLKKLVDSELVM